jgi:hypothetical protein
MSPEVKAESQESPLLVMDYSPLVSESPVMDILLE